MSMKSKTKMVTLTALTAGAIAITATAYAVDRSDNTISKADVVAAQTEWGNGIVAISKVHKKDGNYKSRAAQHINELYAYGLTDVMFKPTLAAEDQFRETFDEALSYFIGTPGTEDGGFAIKGWTNVRWESNAIYTDADSATAMGNYYFTGPDGKKSTCTIHRYLIQANRQFKLS